MLKNKYINTVLLPLLLLVGSFSSFMAKAQRSEVGFAGGGAFYLGDINPKKVFHDTRVSASLFYRYNFSTRVAFRFAGSYGRIMANDKSFGNPRNLNFRNDLIDIAALFEFNFVNFFTGSKQHRFTPYITFGPAVCFSNPYGQYYDAETGSSRWVALRPLHTEGQGLLDYDVKPYSMVHFAIPMGLGFKVSISSHISLGLEWTMRLAFTDYLDDVGGTYADPGVLMSEYGPESSYFADPSGSTHAVGAQRGDKNSFDWYSFAQLTVSIRLGEKDIPCPAYGNQKISRRYRR